MIVKFEDIADLTVTTDKVEGFEYVSGPILWNVQITNKEEAI